MIEVIFFYFGLILLLIKRNKSINLLLFLWLLIGLLPAAIGKEIPHSLRALNSLPVLIMIISLAIIKVGQIIENQINKFKRQKLIKHTAWIYYLIFLFLLLSVDLLKYFKEYYQKFPVYAARDWQYGYNQAIKIASQNEYKVDKIIFTNTYGHADIYTYLFQKRYPLNVLWGEMRNYIFTEINWDRDKFVKNALIIATEKEIPHSIDTNLAELVADIKYPDGSIAFKIIKTNSN